MNDDIEYKPELIKLDPEVANDDLSQEILKRCPASEVSVAEPEQIKDEIKTFDPTLFHIYKKRLFVTHQKGKFLKKCPGTQNYICCGYKILNIGDGCNYDCKFCALQSYINKPFITIYTNLNDLEYEMRDELETHPDRFYRIGTGEFTDSLSLELLNHYSENLIRFFQGYKNCILELKTKSVNIDFLLQKPAQENIIVSFSLNSHKMAELNEDYAPSIDMRIKAAKMCQEHGYRVGFHFDPIIYYKGWKEGYQEVIDSLFHDIDSSRIPWISLGAFRYQPILKKIVKLRFPEADITSGEFFPGLDNKMRYFKPVRLELFSIINEMIKIHDENSTVYLCMESPDVWNKSLKFEKMNDGKLSRMLDNKAMDM